MDELHTWADLAACLDGTPRGTAYKLAEALGLNTSYLYRKVNHPKGELTAAQARKARAFFEALAAGAPAPEPEPFAPQRQDGIIKLPVYGYAAGSDGDMIAFNDGEILEWMELPYGLALAPGEFFILREIGSSMEPRIFSGEYMVVKRKYPPARDKEVVVEFHGGHALIKTYQGQRDGRVFVKQWNPEKTLDFDASSVKALHAMAFKL